MASKSASSVAANAVPLLSDALNGLLADSFALYLKTKNFHWHVMGPQFRSLHLLFDEQAGEILATTDEIAERVRKLGGRTLTSIGDVARKQSLADNDAEAVSAEDMVAELADDNVKLAATLRSVRELCDEHGDFPSVGILEDYLDQAEKRVWFLNASRA